MTDEQPRLMGSTEVATRLGVSPATVARAVQTGRLVPSEVTPGGHSRFSDRDVETYRRQGRRRTAGLNSSQLRDLGELAIRLDASISARHGFRFSDSDWRLLLGRIDQLADAAFDIVDPPAAAEAAPGWQMAQALATLPPALLGGPMPAPSGPVLPVAAADPVSSPAAGSADTPQRPETEPAPEPLEATFFEDGNSGLTLVVRPIERFALIETISGLLSGVQGVGEIRLRRLQRGVAWFTVRYAGALSAATVLPAALAGLGAEVRAVSDRLYEVDLARPAAGAEPVPVSNRSA